MNTKNREDLRAEIGPLYDLCDTIIVIEEIDPEMGKRKKIGELVNELYGQFENEIKQGSPKEQLERGKVWMNATLNTFLLIIKHNIIPEDWHIIKRNLIKEFDSKMNNPDFK